MGRLKCNFCVSNKRTPFQGPTPIWGRLDHRFGCSFRDPIPRWLSENGSDPLFSQYFVNMRGSTRDFSFCSGPNYSKDSAKTLTSIFSIRTSCSRRRFLSCRRTKLAEFAILFSSKDAWLGSLSCSPQRACRKRA